MAKKDNNDQLIFTSEIVEKIKEKADNGFKITRQEKFWFSNFNLVRKNKIVFKRTTEETLEYMKCKLGVCTEGKPFIDPDNQILYKEGIEYFSEQYCKIKREDGSIGEMKLRDYQEDILNLYMKNRFSILIASRQCGKCFNYTTPIVIYNKKEKFEKKLPFFKFLFLTKKNKNIFDHIKYALYSLISTFS